MKINNAELNETVGKIWNAVESLLTQERRHNGLKAAPQEAVVEAREAIDAAVSEMKNTVDNWITERSAK